MTASPSRRVTNQYNQSHQSLPSQQTEIPLTLYPHGEFPSRNQQAHFSSSSSQYQHGHATHNKSDSQTDISSSSYQHGYAAQSKIVSPRRSEGCAMPTSASTPAIHHQHGHAAMHKSASPPASQKQQGYATSHRSASPQRNVVPGGKVGTDEGESLKHQMVCTVFV